MPTRRQAFSHFSAIAMAGLGACSSNSAGQITGGFVHENQSRGHLLAQPRQWPAPSKTVRTRCVIAGGGVAGLAAARRLRQGGQEDFVLLELADAAGGNARGASLRGITHPLGAHYLPTPSAHAPHVAGLLEELGVRRRVFGRWEYDERVLCHSPQERLFFQGAWQEGLLPLDGVSAATLAQYKTFGALVARWQATQSFRIPSLRGTPPSLLDLHSQSFAAYLAAQGLNDAHLLWYLDYCCRDDYGAGLHAVSAWAGVHYFAARHGFGLPNAVGGGESEKSAVLTWPEGNGFLTQAMAQPLGDRLRCKRVVLRIARARNAVTVDAWNAELGIVERYEAAQCIVALPAMIALRVIESPTAELLARGRGIAYAAWSVANLYVRDPLDAGAGAAADMAWDNVAYGSPSLGYVNATHQSTQQWPAPTVLTHYTAWGVGSGARQALLGNDWNALQRQVMADMLRMHPDAASKVEHIAITRYGHAMAVPTPRRNVLAQPSMPRMRFAHSDWAGYSVFEEAFEQGIRAAAQLV